MIERARARDNARRAQYILDLRSAVWSDQNQLTAKIAALCNDSPDGDANA